MLAKCGNNAVGIARELVIFAQVKMTSLSKSQNILSRLCLLSD